MLARARDAAVQTVAYRVDRLINHYFLNPPAKNRPRGDRLTPAAKIAKMAEMGAPFGDPRYRSEPDTFFPVLDAVDLRSTKIGNYGRDGEVFDLSWTSALAPVHPDAKVHERLAERSATNHKAIARGFFHRGAARPAIILLHGYRAGNLDINRYAFPVAGFFSKLGMDVVLAVLPHHGPRGVQGKLPLLPAGDPRVTVESFRHAIVDLRTLVRVLRGRGSSAVGALGMSLGGYTVALLATVEPLDFVVPMIPLASVADMAAHRFDGTPDEIRAQVSALEAMHEVVSPFARPSKVPSERVLVIGGEVDQVTPIEHARRLAEHLNAKLHTFLGGHILQVGREAGFGEVATMLRRVGIISHT